MATSIASDLEELLSCAICLGTLSEPKLLPCSHRFCKPCIVMEMDRSASPKGSSVFFPCPLCKRQVKLGKGRNGEEWILKFETDRLLKDIQELLKQEKDDEREICLTHRKTLSLVCYSCRTTGCYICAWQDHRECPDVKNFQDEAKRLKLDLQEHLEESEKCIEKIALYVAKWSSVEKSLKNQRDYSNRFIQEQLQHLHMESLSKVEDLVQEYEGYIMSTNMPIEIEKEIRRLIETFPRKINGEIDIFDTQFRLQIQNEAIILPQIKEAAKRLESVDDVQILISTVENIKHVLPLRTEELILKGSDLLTQKSNVLCKTYRDKLTKKVDNTSPTVVQDSLVTRPDWIDLGNEKGGRLLRNLQTALRNSQTPKTLVENVGWLCFPNGYQPEFFFNPTVDLKTRNNQQACNTERLQPQLEIHPRINSRPMARQPNPPNRHCVRQERPVCRYFMNHKGRVLFHSYNSLKNKANPEPFPTVITIRERVIPKGFNVRTLPFMCNHFENTDDEEEGLECERCVAEDIGDGFLSETIFTMSYETEKRFTVRVAFKQILKVISVSMFFSILCIILCIYVSL